MAITAALLATPAGAVPSMHFVALGDMPYGDAMRSRPAYHHLIDLINAEHPPFSIHVGDFKSGYFPCTDDEYAEQAANFQRFESALIYTPGDNDWSDCRRAGTDPIERLQALRDVFFATPYSLGQRPLRLQRQSDLATDHAAYRENQRWWHAGVLFATLHTVGPEDNADATLPSLLAEHNHRRAANLAWMRETFALARQGRATALVLATQADVLRRRRPFKRLAVHAAFRELFEATLIPLAQSSPMPVLLVHGDGHRFIADRPFYDAGGLLVDNLWRLQVPGDLSMHAVRVDIDAGASPRFRFKVLWNPRAPAPQ